MGAMIAGLHADLHVANVIDRLSEVLRRNP